MNRRPWIRLAALVLAWGLLAAVPAHVATSDYFGGYAGTHAVAPEVAARWLTWAETNVDDSVTLQRYGVKTLLYTDPFRTISGEPDAPPNGQGFAHDCGGARIEANRAGQFLMDPHDAALLAQWRSHVDRYTADGHFTAVFADDAGNLAYLHGVPCNKSDWMQATAAMMRALGRPVVYNGLSNLSGASPSPALALNGAALGGMMEECYASAPSDPKVSGALWRGEEATELAMVRDRKLFFCYGNDTSPAASSIDGRLFAYASFLLTYDPDLCVLWEYYQTPSRLHVMPESQLVPMDPLRRPSAIADLSTPGGVFTRAYRSCYLAGRDEGPCVVAVNPDRTAAHATEFSGYRRTLELSGAGVLDGGTARISASAPPSQLAPLSAIVAFK